MSKTPAASQASSAALAKRNEKTAVQVVGIASREYKETVSMTARIATFNRRVGRKGESEESVSQGSRKQRQGW